MHPHSTMPTAHCRQCGTPFFSKSPQSKPRKFCSAKCAQVHRKRREPGRTTPIGIRLWRHVRMPLPTIGCWEWLGSRTQFRGKKQHGQIWNGSGKVMAHRVAWEITYGPIPDGMLVLHHCDNPICIRPGHLFLGTQQDNMDDASNKGRLFGKPAVRGERHGCAKLKETDVIEIRKLYRAGGVTKKSLADRFGVTETPLRLVLARKTWTHIPDAADNALAALEADE